MINFKKLFSHQFLRIKLFRESGIYEYLVSDERNSTRLGQNIGEEQRTAEYEFDVITLSHLKAIFQSYLSTLMVSIISFLLERETRNKQILKIIRKYLCDYL